MQDQPSSVPLRPAQRGPLRANRIERSRSILADLRDRGVDQACALRISARLNPNVMSPSAGFCTSRITINDINSAPASVSMGAASEINASECAKMPTTTSPIMNETIRGSAIVSGRLSALREQTGSHVVGEHGQFGSE